MTSEGGARVLGFTELPDQKLAFDTECLPWERAVIRLTSRPREHPTVKRYRGKPMGRGLLKSSRLSTVIPHGPVFSHGECLPSPV